MTRTPAYSPKFLRQRKLLLVFPVLLLPFVYLLAYSLGVGSSPTPARNKAASGPMGFNTELPKALFRQEKTASDKLDAYKKADADSLKRKQWLQQDPYHLRPSDSSRHFPTNANPLPPEDPGAEALLQRLNQLRRSIQQPAAYPIDHPTQQPPAYPIGRLQHTLPSIRSADTGDEDPQLQQLNTMLDKIIRIQHPIEDSATGITEAPVASTASSNAIPAIVPETQTLVAGATIALRLTEAATISGIRIPNNQLIYGVVSISNDRMLINIHSIRSDHSIYSVDWQVYDMDGLPGIHIPGTLNREVAKQSADQGIGSVNLTTFDPSIGAQATNAGLQAAKTLFSRKVKLIRVSVRAGYQVLLHSTKATTFSKPAIRQQEIAGPSPIQYPATHPDSAAHPDPAALADPPANPTPIAPPVNPRLPAFLHHTVATEKLSLTLRGIYLQQNILWFSLLLYNDSPIDYIPESARWVVRDRHQWKRTAIQDLPMSPVYMPPPIVLPGYSNRSWWVGFQPFALAKDKELVLEIGERSGARVLTMAIDHKEILKAKMQEP